MKVWAEHAEARRRDKEARARGAAMEQELLSLTPNERAVLAQFVGTGQEDSILPREHILGSTAHALSLRGHLIHMEENRNAFSVERTYMIQEQVFAILARHPEALQRASDAEE